MSNNRENTETLYRMVEIKGGKKIEKFKSPDLKRVLFFFLWYVKNYKTGLLLEILPLKKHYNWKEKTIDYTFE